jgi:hypothetical protein
VSTTTTSCIVRRACSIDSRATWTGSPTPLPGCGVKTSTPGVALALEPAAELSGQCRLTGALETGQHDDRRRGLGHPDAAGLPAEDADELLVDDLDDLLRRVQRTGHLGAGRALLDRRDERADHRQRDVGLEQRDADLARGGVDVGLGEPALATQAAEDLVHTVGEGLEHSTSSEVTGAGGPHHLTARVSSGQAA